MCASLLYPPADAPCCFQIPSWVHGLEAEAALALLFDPLTAERAWKHYSALYPGDTTSAFIKILTDYVFTCSSQALALALPAPSFTYAYNHLDSFGAAIFAKFNLPQCVSWNQIPPARQLVFKSPCASAGLKSSQLDWALTSADQIHHAPGVRFRMWQLRLMSPSSVPP